MRSPGCCSDNSATGLGLVYGEPWGVFVPFLAFCIPHQAPKAPRPAPAPSGSELTHKRSKTTSPTHSQPQINPESFRWSGSVWEFQFSMALPSCFLSQVTSVPKLQEQGFIFLPQTLGVRCPRDTSCPTRGGEFPTETLPSKTSMEKHRIKYEEDGSSPRRVCWW